MHRKTFIRSQWLALVGCIALNASAFADSLSSDKEVLKKISGCFKVTYRFVEDGTHDSRFDNVEGKDFYEWIALTEVDDTLRFQHYGIAGNQAMKHWSEDWKETPDHQWNQKVFDPSRKEIRYECTAPFHFNQWDCHAGKAAKPVIRDRGRTDYVKLDRKNTLQITPKGWIQVEINNKLDSADRVVSNEVGWNEYLRVDETHCDPAKNLINNS